jgi:hypothetical protein
MGGRAPKVEAPQPDPAQAAYNNYMIDRQRTLDTQSQAAAETERANIEGIKSAGYTGWVSYRDSVANQFNSGLLDSTQASQKLQDYEDRFKLGTGYAQGDIDYFTNAATQAAPGKSATLAGQTYKDILGREATATELADFGKLQQTGQYKLTDLVNSIKSGSEYQNKFNDNYLSSYYDTMYGKQGTTTDASGQTVKTGTRTFNYNAAFDPTFAGDLGKSTGIATAAAPTNFSGTPAEIEEFQQAMRQKRDFMYNAGLTNLQGQIDKDTQKIKNEGSADVARIGTQGQMLSNLTAGFWS